MDLEAALENCGFPRPWRYETSIDGTIVVLDANGVAVCDCGRETDGPDPAAELIVAAVNQSARIAALEAVLRDAVERCRIVESERPLEAALTKALAALRCERRSFRIPDGARPVKPVGGQTMQQDDTGKY